jgi:hypothetical protein
MKLLTEITLDKNINISLGYTMFLSTIVGIYSTSD